VRLKSGGEIRVARARGEEALGVYRRPRASDSIACRDGCRGFPGHGQPGHQAENVPVLRHSALRAVRAARPGGLRTR